MRRQLRAGLFRLFFVILLASGGAFSVAAQTAGKEDTIRVLILKNFPPQFVSTPKGPSGLAVEVMQNVAQRAGLKIDYVTVDTWPQVYPLLKDKSVDALANMGISDARRKIVEFTDPYEVFDVKVFVRKETADIETFDDLGERILGLMKTNVLTKDLVKADKYKTKTYPSFQTLLLGLLAGEVDAIVAPSEPFLLLARGADLDDRLKFVGPSLLEIKRAIALPKGATHLRDRLNTALMAFKHTAEYQALLTKWYGSPKAYWTHTKTFILGGAIFAAMILIFGTWRYVVIVGFNRRIRNSEARLYAHIENTPLAAISWDRSFHCTEWNKAAEEIFGYTADDAIGRHASEIVVSSKLKDDINSIYQTLIEQNVASRSTHENNTKDGRTIVCEWYNTPIVDMNGEVIAVASLAQDVSERVYAEAELRLHRDHLEELVSERTAEVQEKATQLEAALKSEKNYSNLQQQFVSLVSHEFRTPLSIIDGAVHRIIRLKDKITPEQLVERGSKIRHAVERMVELIDSTLYAENLDQGNFPFTPKALDLKAVVAAASDYQAEISPDHQIRLDIDALPPTIYADGKLLKHAFQNLLSNAVKYSLNSPQIEVKGWTEGDFALISIKDHGVGISANDLPNMFQRFFRATTSKGIQGTGVGLSVCKQFIEMHGGDISLESVEGEGTTFTVKLRIAEAAEPKTST